MTCTVILVAALDRAAAAQCPEPSDYQLVPLPGAPQEVIDLEVFDAGEGPKLFAASRFSDVLHRYDDPGWTAIQVPVLGQFEIVSALLSRDLDGSGTNLFVATSQPGQPALASRLLRWDGMTWTTIGEFLGGEGIIEIGIHDFDSNDAETDLVVAGAFTSVDGVAAGGLAYWDGATWHPFNGPIGGLIRAMYSPVTKPVPPNESPLLLLAGDTGAYIVNQATNVVLSDPGFAGTWCVAPFANHVAFGGLYGLMTNVTTADVDGTVHELLAWNDGTGERLYIGGDFDAVPEAGLTGLGGVVALDAQGAWHPLAQPSDTPVRALLGFTDSGPPASCPSLFVGGQCNLARWGPPRLSGDLEEYLWTVPILDTEEGGYAEVDAAEQASWAQLLEHLFAAEYAEARALSPMHGYDLIDFDDVTSGKTYHILVERCDSFTPSNPRRGQGTYVFDPGWSRALNIQAPHAHPCHDTNSRDESIAMFRELEAAWLQLAGAHRCACECKPICPDPDPPPFCGYDDDFWDDVACRSLCQPGTINSPSYAITDIAHNVDHFFQVSSDVVAATWPDLVSVSVHGWTPRTDQQLISPLAVLSNGLNAAPFENSLATRLALAMNAQLQELIPPGSGQRLAGSENATVADPESVQILAGASAPSGNDNTQGRSINGGVPCSPIGNSPSSLTIERFIHLEQQRALRRRPPEKGPGGPGGCSIGNSPYPEVNWQVTIDAFREVFPPVGCPDPFGDPLELTVTTQCGAGADTHIRGGSFADSNYGKDPTLVVKNDSSASFSRKVYVRFDVSELPKPFSTATVRLTVASHNGGVPPSQSFTHNLYGLDDGVDEAWPEGSGSGSDGITWNTAPANDAGSGNGFTSDAQLLATHIAPPASPVGGSFDFSSPALLDFLHDDQDGLVSFMVSRAQVSAEGYNFASRENAPYEPPALVVSFAPPCPGDTNGDGMVDVTDLVNVILNWATGDPGADVNADGTVDVGDLIGVVLAWGPC